MYCTCMPMALPQEKRPLSDGISHDGAGHAAAVVWQEGATGVSWARRSAQRLPRGETAPGGQSPAPPATRSLRPHTHVCIARKGAYRSRCTGTCTAPPTLPPPPCRAHGGIPIEAYLIGVYIHTVPDVVRAGGGGGGRERWAGPVGRGSARQRPTALTRHHPHTAAGQHLGGSRRRRRSVPPSAAAIVNAPHVPRGA